jgi:hypothetical protein
MTVVINMIITVVVMNMVTIMVTVVTDAEHKDRIGNDSTVRDCVVITIKQGFIMSIGRGVFISEVHVMLLTKFGVQFPTRGSETGHREHARKKEHPNTGCSLWP